MIRALAIVTTLAATATSASAGVYGSLGVGNTGVDDDVSTGQFTAASRSLRFAGGYQFMKYVGAEAGVIGYDVDHGTIPYSGRELYAAGVGHVPIANGFGAFGRLGIQRTSLDTDTSHSDLSGTGYIFGAGFEYKLGLPPALPVNASIWVDYTRNSQSLDKAGGGDLGRSIGESMWTLGVTVGL